MIACIKQLFYSPLDKPCVLSESHQNASHSTKSLQLVPNLCTKSKHRDSFDKIYSDGCWGGKLRSKDDFYGDAHWPTTRVQTSASGGGSNLGYATETSLKIIKDTIVKYNVKSMVDIPCGDLNWIFDSFLADSLPVYASLDVAANTIALNQQRFAHHSNKVIEFWDATTCEIPMYSTIPHGSGGRGLPESFDLAHVRDVIQHLPLKDGVEFFCNVFRAGIRVLITTSYNSDMKKNKDVRSGSFETINLENPPFSFPKGDCTLTHPNMEKDFTCVYNLTQSSWVKEYISKNCVPT